MTAVDFAEDSLLNLLFKKSLTPIAFMDLNFNFIHVNQAYASTDNKNIDYFPGKNHFDLYPNDENKIIFETVVKTGKTYETKAKAFEYVNTPDKGVTFWDWSLSLVNDNDGQAVGVLLQLIDVTWNIKTEQKLYEKVKDELSNYDQELEQIIESRTKLLQETVTLLQLENKERIKTQELMVKAKEDAEKANVSKSQFLSRMSHELRTPLNAILGFSQLLTLNDLNEKQNSYNEEILLAGGHLLAMISDVLDLSRIETGDLSISISQSPLFKIVSESVSLVEHKLGYRNITTHNLISEDDETLLLVDSTRIKEVLVNILTNAVKYNVDNGLILIGYKKIDKDNICIYISDTGKGLSDEDQSKIFDPFNRLGAEYTDIEGVGIGLTISQKLMQMMGGEIKIESEKGKGSTFNIICPIGNMHGINVDKEECVDLNDTDYFYNVLYVEDNVSNQKIIRNLFCEYSNVDLKITPSAEEGLKAIADMHFDLIILDINLPGMDGYEALEKIKMNAKTKDIPVVALSASASQGDIKKGLEAGFKRYITKPIILKEVTSIINDELNHITHH
jgi:PAS domain S-box-containing protein